MSLEPVAADTNLLRQPTTRRYITTMESARGRQIIILPTVDHELKRHLPMQMGEHLDWLARSDKKTEHPMLGEAKAQGGNAAGLWWRDERQRNRSVYRFATERDWQEYSKAIASLPSAAFTDKNTNDQSIYAEAIVHGANVLSTRNRNTIIEEVLTEHFQREGYAEAPVVLRNLWQQTVAIAKAERRATNEVALETVLCAVIPEGWTATTAHAFNVRKSVDRFTENLRVQAKENAIDPEREKLVHILDSFTNSLGEAQFLARCETAYGLRPEAARTSAMRFDEHTRAAVRRTGLDFW